MLAARGLAVVSHRRGLAQDICLDRTLSRHEHPAHIAIFRLYWMKPGWPYQLVLVFSALVASVSSIGLFNYIAALGQLRTLAPGVSVEWSGYIIPVVQLLLALAVSVIGFLGVLLGTPARARIGRWAYGANVR